MVKRNGNWYSVELRGMEYNVLIQKDKGRVTCEPSSILVFDDNFNKVEDYSVWNEIEEMMEVMDWKSDILVGV
jgi:hypothetical protein